MVEYIGSRVIGMVAGDIEALLNENQSAINNAYCTIGKGTKVSVSVSFAPNPKGVETEIKISFATEIVEQPEKCKSSVKRIMCENQEDLPLEVK
jgi:hypothetical protein